MTEHRSEKYLPSMDSEEIEAEFERLALSDPASAITQVETFIEQHQKAAEDRNGTGGTVRMLRSAALAARSTRDLKLSNEYLDRALALPQFPEHRSDRTRLLLTKAYNLFLLGDHVRSVDLVSGLRGDGDAHLQAQIDFQFATILGRLSRNSEAIERLSQALQTVVQTDDRYLHSQILKNRGMFHARDGEYQAAIDDIGDAKDLCVDIGLDFEAAFCDLNLGLAASYAGDLPLAFAQFEVSEPRIRELSGSDFESKTGHCKALLFGGLYQEAADMAGEAAEQCEAAGFMVDAAETRMLEAVALLEAGNPELAAERAERAAAAFADQARDGWHAAAETVLFLLRHRSGVSIDESRLRDNIDRLQVLGQHNDSLEATLLLVEVLADRGQLDRAQSAFDQNRDAISASTMDLRLAGAATEALLLERSGRLPEALSLAEQGFELLTAQQALIGSSDLRVGLRQHGDRLSRFGIRQSLVAGDPISALRWIERGDLATNTPRPVRPSKDPQMQRALSRLRALDDDQLDKKRALEDSIRTLDRAHPGASSPVSPATIEQLTEKLGPTVGVTYGVDDGQLFACTVVDGNSAIHKLGSIEDTIRVTRAARAALRRRISMADGVRTTAATTSGWKPVQQSTDRSQATLKRLDELLLAPLSIDRRAMVICPTPQLFAVPWNALPSRIGVPTSVSSSLTSWALAPEPDLSGASVLVAGPELHNAELEVQAIQSRVQQPTVLTGADAKATEVLQAMDGAALAHIVAHGTVRTDNPLFSSLHLADGQLSVYELSDLARPPAIVVLSACHVGLPADAPGRELLGMATGFSNAGTSCILASTLPVPDDQTTIDIMSRFHEFMSAGLGPAAAWAEVQNSCPETDELLDTASFMVFGRG